MDTTTVIIVWIVCGLIAGSIYHNKGRSTATGFLAGLILGPIGVILALASGKNQAGLAKQEEAAVESRIAAGELRKCPYCAEAVKAEAVVCRYCGHELVPLPPVAKSATYDPPPVPYK